MRVILILSSDGDRGLFGLRSGMSVCMADIKLFEIEGPEVFLGLDIGVTKG